MIKYPKYKTNILDILKEINDGIKKAKKKQDANKYMM